MQFKIAMTKYLLTHVFFLFCEWIFSTMVMFSLSFLLFIIVFNQFLYNVVFICNENQLHALFTLNLLRQTTSTHFGHIYCPSSGGIHCICTAIGTCYVYRWLAIGEIRLTQTAASHIYVLHAPTAVHLQWIPPGDGQYTCPKHVEVVWSNKLRIDSESSWFSLQRLSTCTVNKILKKGCISCII
jgi:hypothetical protein